MYSSNQNLDEVIILPRQVAQCQMRTLDPALNSFRRSSVSDLLQTYSAINHKTIINPLPIQGYICPLFTSTTIMSWKYLAAEPPVCKPDVRCYGGKPTVTDNLEK